VFPQTAVFVYPQKEKSGDVRFTDVWNMSASPHATTVHLEQLVQSCLKVGRAQHRWKTSTSPLPVVEKQNFLTFQGH
jgi:hypothetical protein